MLVYEQLPYNRHALTARGVPSHKKVLFDTREKIVRQAGMPAVVLPSYPRRSSSSVTFPYSEMARARRSNVLWLTGNLRFSARAHIEREDPGARGPFEHEPLAVWSLKKILYCHCRRTGRARFPLAVPWAVPMETQAHAGF